MSNKHNYSQYSNKKRETESGAPAPNAAKINKPAAPKVEEKVASEVKMEPVAKPVVPVEPVKPAKPVLVEEEVKTALLPKTVNGVVANCSKLNVRAEPSLFADVVCVLDAEAEVKIDVAQSNQDWFRINTAIGEEGYCMRRFVNAYT